MVYYRKYRPQKISELDSKAVRETLESVVRSGKIAHAFLFAGPKGLGKTSAARILAKIVNCEKLKVESGKLKVVEPCNKCSQCVSITEGSNLDVLEIDGASNRGIDEIRDLRDKIKLAPFSARMKVYIIDEVHMLTAEAFNALLKTLEEPPWHAMFILCTTEPQKLPETITSRCFVVTFNKPNRDELLRSFGRIVKAEKINIERSVLVKIAELSDDSFRDGVKLLEQLVVGAGRKKITEKIFEEMYQVSSIKYQVSKLLEFIEKKDAKIALKFINSEITKGLNIKTFMPKFLERLHEILLEKVKGGDVGFSLDEIRKLMAIFSQAAQDAKYAVIPQLPLELGIVEWVYGETAGRLPHAERDARQPLTDDQDVLSSSLNERRPPKVIKSSDKKTKSAFSSLSGGHASISLNDLIGKVKSYNHSVAGVLRGCSIKSYDGKRLVIEAGFKFHQERLDEQKTRKLLEKVAEDVIGDKVNVSIVLKSA